MSGHEVYLSMCSGKSSFTSWETANKRSLSIRRRKAHDVVIPYKCRYCGQWHLGGVETEYRKSSKQQRLRDFEGK